MYKHPLEVYDKSRRDYYRGVNKDLRRLLCAIAILKPGLIIPRHLIEGANESKLEIKRSLDVDGFYIFYNEEKK